MLATTNKHKAYDQLHIKALTVMAGEVAIVSFMFSGERVHIPVNMINKADEEAQSPLLDEPDNETKGAQ